MTNYAPDLMFEHMLVPRKGWVKSNQLDCAAKKSANVTFSLKAGRVVHLNNSKEFETGCANTQMAIFLLQGDNAPSVDNPGTTQAGNFVHRAVLPAQVMSGLVATGGYELSSTEFDTGQTYNPNQTLQATVANTNATTGGRLTVGTAYTDAICGVVSQGVINLDQDASAVDVLCFWPVWLPPTP